MVPLDFYKPCRLKLRVIAPYCDFFLPKKRIMLFFLFLQWGSEVF